MGANVTLSLKKNASKFWKRLIYVFKTYFEALFRIFILMNSTANEKAIAKYK